MSSFRRTVLIAFFLGMAAPPAHSQDPAASAPAIPGAEEPSSLQPAQGRFSAAATEANAAVLAEGRGWCGLQARETGALAGLAQRLGDLKVVGPALLASYITGRVGGVPGFSAASARVAGATVGAAALCGGLQSTVGRLPGLARDEAGAMPLLGGSGASFPSARTTVAFAAAAAVHAESRARWVPWVVYPAAASVIWADACESGHGLGGAAAGAALGLAAGRALDRIEYNRVRLFDRAHFLAHGSRRDFRVGFQTRF